MTEYIQSWHTVCRANIIHPSVSVWAVCLVSSDSLQPHGLQPARLLCPWGFSRQEYWSGLPCPPPGDLPNPGIEPRSPALHVDSLPSEPPGRQVYWTDQPIPSSRDLPDPGIELGSPALQVDSLPAQLTEKLPQNSDIKKNFFGHSQMKFSS